MKKRLLSLLMALALVLTLAGCGNDTVEQNKPVEPAKPSVPARPEVVKLDKEVTEDMDFFKDGYEIVTVHSYKDGDTTDFQLKNKELSQNNDGVYATRYLAIDTPETSNGIDPWGATAKEYLNNMLKNAKQIVLVRDAELPSNVPGDDDATFDKYGRLLAHVFVDGELVQWHMVNESLAWVKYLYKDYKYNPELVGLELYVTKYDNRRVHNPEDLDPNYDYTVDNTKKEIKIADITKDMINKKKVITTGVVTGKQGGNMFIQDGDEAIYVYTNHLRYDECTIGSLISLDGSVSSYHGQLQIANLETRPVVISEGHAVEPKLITAADMNESNESLKVRINDITVNSIDPNIGKVTCTDKDGNKVIVFVPGEVSKVVTKDDLEVGKTYDFIGNLGVHDGDYQIMLLTKEEAILK